MDYTLYEIIWIFFTYGFLGWCAEVIFAAAVDGKFVNRGFDIGPICPIYGFGMLLVLACLEGVKDNLPLLFVASVLLTSLLEFIVGYQLERFFNQKWWDYSNEPLNIKGFVCLRMSLLWGIACVSIVNLVHPAIMRFIRFIPHTLGIILLIIFSAAFLTDFSVTVANLLKIKKTLRSIGEIESALEKVSVSLGTSLSDTTISVMDKGEKLKDTINERKLDLELSKAEFAEKLRDKGHDDEISLEQRRAQLRENLDAQLCLLEKRMKRLRKAFPHITEGRLKRFFEAQTEKRNQNK